MIFVDLLHLYFAGYTHLNIWCLAQWPCIEFCANHHSISKLIQSKTNLKRSHPYPFFESYNNDPCGKTLKNIHTKLPTSQPIHSTLNLAGDSDKRLLSTWSCVMISVQNGQSFNKIRQEKPMCRCWWQWRCKFRVHLLKSTYFTNLELSEVRVISWESSSKGFWCHSRDGYTCTRTQHS